MRRRDFLISCSCASFAAVTARPARAVDAPARIATEGRRWLELFNTHTGERLSLAFRDAGGLINTALSRLEWVFRDHRANESHPIDAPLFDWLADLADAAGAEPRYEIISGYRSPATNEQLAAAGRGVARGSMHMQGRAIDVRMKGLSSAKLRDLALAAPLGGVGFYARSNFVHLDTGRVRHWSG